MTDSTEIDADIPTDAAPEAGKEEIRKPELIEMVVAASGAKRKDVKPIVEATLSVLGQALSDRRVLNVQPLGKVMVNRESTKTNAQVLVVKIRRSIDAQKATEGLAEPDD